MNITLRYALRSLFRHRRRAILSIVGIGVGCAVCLFLVSFIRGEGEMMMRAAANSGTGHLQIVPSEWLQTRDLNLRLPDWDARRQSAKGTDNILLAAPHARSEALLAMGTRTAGVLVTGVDPEVEPRLNRLVRKVEEGGYLDAATPGGIVIGRVLATRLDVATGDELVVTASGHNGEMRSAMLTVHGIISTGSRSLDAGLCHVLLDDLAAITGRPPAAEITVILEHPRQLEVTRAHLAAALPPGATVITWKEIIPELAAGVEVDRTFTNLTIGVIVIVVFLGIASAQLAAALERRKEFALLSAVGMQGDNLVRIMFIEGFILGLLGAVMSLLIGTPLVHTISTRGMDLSGFYGDADLAMSNILIDPVLYGNIDWWLLPLSFALSLGATLLSSVYPALYARRTDPAEALRVDR